MKKQHPFRSAFFDPRVLVAIAVCAIGLLFALVAFGPGGKALAQYASQDQASIPEWVQENVNVAQGTVVTITRSPLEGSGTFDLPALISEAVAAPDPYGQAE